MTTTAATTIELTPDTPTVASWKEKLKDRPYDYLVRIAYGRPSAVDASHRYACELILQSKHKHDFEAVTPELGSVIHDMREEKLVELAKLVLWLDWIPVPLHHRATDGLSFVRDELIYEITRYTAILDRCEEECGGY